MNQMKLVKLLPYALSLIIPVVLFIINSLETYIPFPFDIIVYFLSFLGVISITNTISLHNLEKKMDFFLRLFKSVVDSWKVSSSIVMIGRPVREKELKEKLRKYTKDYNWVQENKENLFNKHPDEYVAVKDKDVHFTDEDMEKLVNKMLIAGEEISEYVIEFITDQEVCLIL